MPADLQSFPEAVDQGLEQGFIVGYGLQYVSIRRHIADGPLAQTRTAQPEDVTVGGEGENTRAEMRWSYVTPSHTKKKKKRRRRRGENRLQHRKSFEVMQTWFMNILPLHM